MTQQSTDPPRRTRLSREARGTQLLDVAEALFAERGFEGVSMEDIARTAGVTRPMVYVHHGTKDQIFLACARRARAELDAAISDPEALAQAGASVDEVIERAGTVFFAILERDPRRWLVLFNPSASLSEDLAAELRAMRDRTIARIARMTSPFAPFDDDRNTAFAYAISGVGEQLGRWWIANPDVPVSQVVGYYRDFITTGLRTS
ncbi:TetR/AcrR family transcriptional regulator [Nocardiopsis ansamitocini]|uniref:TetR family transcriptional regulator n=1 Tax=Nocardiopsis ansamitocini TaxID=1670832 RepID=A0A9W6P9U9_9ACTN|nr:TetR/AcrR family transcriptional regulator [Nocardiopsis ansamitocini]GLU50279.1 TetR family transcriptional regulator [Nocardiopsis ansamitocini]